MNSVQEESLARLAAAGLGNCLRRLSTASQAEWRLESARVLSGKAPFPPGVEGVTVSLDGGTPVSTVLVFSGTDAAGLCGCFADCAAFGPGRDREILLELGNILLNSFLNALLRALGRSAIPSVPAYLTALDAWPGAGPAAAAVSATLSAARNGRRVTAEIRAALPPDLLKSL